MFLNPQKYLLRSLLLSSSKKLKAKSQLEPKKKVICVNQHLRPQAGHNHYPSPNLQLEGQRCLSIETQEDFSAT